MCSSDLNLTVAGTLTVVYLDPSPGQSIRLNALAGLTIATDINIGTASLQLETLGALQVSGEISAGRLTVNAATVNEVINSRVDSISFTLSNPNSTLTIFDADDLTISSSTGTSSRITASSGGSLELNGSITGLAELTATSEEVLSTVAGTVVTVSGLSKLTGASIDVGSSTGATFNSGSLNFTSVGSVRIAESSSSLLSGDSKAGTLTMISTSAITSALDSGMDVTGNASFTGSTITVGGQAGDDFRSGSLTFNSTGATAVSMTSSLNLSGQSAAQSATLTSTSALTSVTGSQLTVTNAATFNAASVSLAATSNEILTIAGNAIFNVSNGGNIIVASAGTTNFGSLQFNTTGNVTVFEDSATDLRGANTEIGRAHV